MRPLFTIALNDLRIILRSRAAWVELLVMPCVLALAVGLANGAAGGTPSAPRLIIDIADADNSADSATFIAALRVANPNFILCPIDNDAADACQLGDVPYDPERRLSEQVSLALVEIPAGFSAALARGEAVEIVYRSGENTAAPTSIAQAVEAVARRLGGAVIAARVGGDVAAAFPVLRDDVTAVEAEIAARARSLWETPPVVVDYVLTGQPQIAARGGGGFGQSIPGMATMYVMFAVLPVMANFILERKQGTMQRLATMPVRRAHILGGKLLARFALGLLQYAVIFAFGLLLGVRYGDNPLALVLVMLAYTLCVTALALALSTLVRTEGQAGGVSLFLTMTLAPLGGAWWPLEIVPGWMQALGHISPIAWAMNGYRALMFYGGGLGDVLIPVAVLAGAALLLFAFGVARFRVE
jgi:ABC-2 type transport system permease protein